MSIVDIAPALLEDWLRESYFDATVDISSSGVENYSLGELRDILGISVADLDAIPFRDSPSWGCRPLRELIAARGGYPSADQLMVTHGSTEGLFLALAAVVRPGDEIVALTPAYQSLISIAESLGARLVPWRLDAETGFRPDLERLRSVLTERTRMVVVNFPHNPTGATLTKEEFGAFMALLDGHSCHLVWDGAFSEIVFDGRPLPEPAALRERVISTGTLSKAYGLPGIRVGWCSAPPEVLADMVRIRDYVSLNTSPLTEAIATAVLAAPDDVLAPRLRQAAANRETLRTWALETPRVSLPLPRGGVSAFPSISGVDDTTGMCLGLQERGVLVVPGRCFGHPDRVRIGFGGPGEELADGLSAVAAYLDGSVGPADRTGE